MRDRLEIPTASRSRITIVEPPPRRRTLPGQLLIQLEPEAVRERGAMRSLAFARSAASLLPESVSKPLEYLEKNAGLRALEPVFHERATSFARAAIHGGARRRVAALTSVVNAPTHELAGVNIAHIDPNKLTPALIRRLRESSAIRIVEPVPARWLAKKKTHSDPKANKQWGLNAIDWHGAKRTSAAKLVCGIIDSGIDRGHPDLAGVVAAYDHAGTSASDVIGHGTHVAGIIAALANNDVGITGVVDCKLSIWKVFDDEPDPVDGQYYVDMDRYLKALRAMEETKVSALNLSLGGTESSKVEALLMKRLAKAGVSVFAAMGNEYEEGNPTEYPAAYATVWAVGAVNAASQRAEFSNTGKHIHIAAPGVSILSTLPRTRSKARDETNYASWDGTSMATPYVSGAALLLCAKGAHKTPKSIARRLASTATRLKGMGSKSKSTSFGAGLLNLEKALR